MAEDIILTPFITEKQINERIERMAQEISHTLGEETFVLVSILNGAFVFTADLIRCLYNQKSHLKVDFIRASSYGEADVSSGNVTILYDTSLPLNDRNVLLVDDICDSGRTLKELHDYLLTKGARKVWTCVLMDKPSRRVVDFNPDWVGFKIPDKFVVGYGLDLAQQYRDIPFIAIVEKNHS